MYHLIKQPEEQLRILFRNTAQKTGLHEAIVEKDFWVCLTLDYLFHYCPWKEAFILDDQGGHFAVFDFFQKFAPTWTVEVCPGISIVHEKQWI